MSKATIYEGVYADQEGLHQYTPALKEKDEVLKYVNEKGGRLIHINIIRVVTCCGNEIRCTEFINTCPSCGSSYNWQGKRKYTAARESSYAEGMRDEHY